MVGGTVWLLVGKERQSGELRRPDRAPRAHSVELRAAPNGVSGVIRF